MPKQLGGYALNHVLGKAAMTDRVREFRQHLPRYFPLPHPSWRNSGWLDRNPWFEAELLPVLRADIGGLLRREPLTFGHATFRSARPFEHGKCPSGARTR